MVHFKHDVYWRYTILVRNPRNRRRTQEKKKKRKNLQEKKTKKTPLLLNLLTLLFSAQVVSDSLSFKVTVQPTIAQLLLLLATTFC